MLKERPHLEATDNDYHDIAEALNAKHRAGTTTVTVDREALWRLFRDQQRLITLHRGRIEGHI